MGASMQYVQDPAVWQTGRLRHGVYMYRGSAQMDIWGVGHLPNCFATKMARTFMPTVFYWLLDYWLQGTILTSYHYFVSFWDWALSADQHIIVCKVTISFLKLTPMGICGILSGESTVLCGDGRMDSPGFNAKYCVYVLMERFVEFIADI